MSPELVANIEATGVGVLHPAHALDQIWFGSLDQPVTQLQSFGGLSRCGREPFFAESIARHFKYPNSRHQS
jgi:hypothetical protein